MRMVKWYELKEGTSKVTVPEASSVVCAGVEDGKVGVMMEVETEGKEFMEIAFLVCKPLDEIGEEMTLNFIGVVYPSPESGMRMVWEIL